MKRFSTVLCAAMMMLLATVGSTRAAGRVATRDWFHGAFAEASWQTSPTESGFLLASRERDGTTHLSVHLFSLELDGEGEVVAGTEIGGSTTSGVSFQIDTVKFTAASVVGSVPVSRCTFDADGVTTGCIAAGSLDVTADWTGIGRIPHEPDTAVFKDGGCIVVDHDSSVEREAVARVVVGGSSHPGLGHRFRRLRQGERRAADGLPSVRRVARAPAAPATLHRLRSSSRISVSNSISVGPAGSSSLGNSRL